jgi:hypothetical protein
VLFTPTKLKIIFETCKIFLEITTILFAANGIIRELGTQR